MEFYRFLRSMFFLLFLLNFVGLISIYEISTDFYIGGIVENSYRITDWFLFGECCLILVLVNFFILFFGYRIEVKKRND